jgi:hypothetical protein
MSAVTTAALEEITGAPAWTNWFVKTTRSPLPSMAGSFPRSQTNGQAPVGSDRRVGCSRSWGVMGR